MQRAAEHAHAQAPTSAVRDGPEASLDCHKGIVDPRRGGCPRWPEHLRLLNEATGELVQGRCRATNLCRYCQRLYVLETVEMLLLDAAEYAPTLWLVLTAREHLTRAQCRLHLAALSVAVRRRWPAAEWFVQVEFQRRGALHLNLLVKGVADDDREAFEALVTERWCARVDALPAGQWSGSITEAGGIVRYLAKHLSHGLKTEQAPPIGWRGHRTSQTRGYLVRPASAMRQEARRARALKRELWRALEAGERGLDAEIAAQQALGRSEAASWRVLYTAPPKSAPLTEEERDGSKPAGLGACVAQLAADVEAASDPESAPGLAGPQGRRPNAGGGRRRDRAAPTARAAPPKWLPLTAISWTVTVQRWPRQRC